MFMGCVDNVDIVIGRGLLRDVKADGQIFLRLERVGKRVNALCSADGEQWWTVGNVAFPVEGPLQVGVHAIAFRNFMRSIYHGAYPEMWRL